MKRIWSRAFSLVAIAMATAAAAPACVENNETIFIRNVMAPSQNRTNGTCVYQPDPAQPALFEGFLDVGVRDDYTAIFLLGNQLVQRGDPTAPRTESNRVVLQGSTVRLTKTDGTKIGEFTTYGTGFVDVGTANTPGFGLYGAPIVDAPTAAGLAAGIQNRQTTQQILAYVKIFGQTLGGVDVETGEYQLPIRVCKGCLVSFATGNDPAITPNPNCAKAGTSTTATSGTITPCFPGQDETTPCELCVGRPVCNNGT